MRLENIQPSQLYINTEKLTSIKKEYSGHPEEIPPVPLKRLDDDIILTDGHTRALFAHLAGAERIAVYWDNDELDWNSYKVCVKWCKREEIYSIADLADRIVTSADFENLWIKRCEKLHRTINQRDTKAQG